MLTDVYFFWPLRQASWNKTAHALQVTITAGIKEHIHIRIKAEFKKASNSSQAGINQYAKEYETDFN